MYMKKCTTRLTLDCLKIYNILCGNYYVTTEEIIYYVENDTIPTSKNNT